MIYYEYVNNLSAEDETTMNEMVMDAKSITNSLISAGHPLDWNISTVERIGLTDGNYRLDQSKLDEFASMNSSFIRRKFDTRFDYYFFLEDNQGAKINFSGVDSIGSYSNSSERLVQITRVVIHNSSIVKMVVYLW